MAISPDHPSSQLNSGGLRRGSQLRLLSLGIGLLALTGLTTYSSGTDTSKGSKSTIGTVGWLS